MARENRTPAARATLTAVRAVTAAPEPDADATWSLDEPEELNDTVRRALAYADEEWEPPEWQAFLPEPVPEPAPAPLPKCPPHHWLIKEGSEPGMLAWTCVRCQAAREVPRDPSPEWRSRGEQRRALSVPPASFAS